MGLLRGIWGDFQQENDRVRSSWWSLPEPEKGLEEARRVLQFVLPHFSQALAGPHRSAGPAATAHPPSHPVFGRGVAAVRSVGWGRLSSSLRPRWRVQEHTSHPCWVNQKTVETTAGATGFQEGPDPLLLQAADSNNCLSFLRDCVLPSAARVSHTAKRHLSIFWRKHYIRNTVTINPDPVESFKTRFFDFS